MARVGGTALVLSLLSLGLAGYGVYKIDRIEDTLRLKQPEALVMHHGPLPSTSPPDAAAMEQVHPSEDQASSTSASSPSSSTTDDKMSDAVANQSFVKGKLAKGLGEVEVLSVKRIRDPYTKLPNVVNVQLRLRRAKTSPQDLSYDLRHIYISRAIVRDPDTSQVFKVWQGKDDSGHSETQYSDSVDVEKIPRGASADVYAWFTVPEHVKLVNVYLPNSSALENLPITNIR
jgi:hypothetical protein